MKKRFIILSYNCGDKKETKESFADLNLQPFIRLQNSLKLRLNNKFNIKLNKYPPLRMIFLALLFHLLLNVSTLDKFIKPESTCITFSCAGTIANPFRNVLQAIQAVGSPGVTVNFYLMNTTKSHWMFME